MAPRRTARLLDRIEDLIMTGALAPGARLDEMSLATQFGVSRTPVREALRALAASGVVEHRPNRGAIVKPIGPTERAEMFEVMAALEAMCAEGAALRATAAEVAAIRESHAACSEAAEAADNDAYYYMNEAFHETIDAACGNSFLSGHTRALRRRLKPYRRVQLRASGRLAASLAEHAAVLAAIEAGDAAAAREHMRVHVAVQGARFTDVTGHPG